MADMTDDRYAYSCWQDDSIIPEDYTVKIGSGFIVNFLYSNRIEKGNNDDVLLLNAFTSFRYLDSKYKDSWEMTLHSHLFKVNIPEKVRYSIIDDVISFIDSISVVAAEENHNKSNDSDRTATEEEEEKKKKKKIGIVVKFEVRTLQRPSESEQEVINRAFNESLDAVVRDILCPPGEGRREFMEAMYAEAEAEGVLETGNIVRVNAAKSIIPSLECVKCESRRSCIICEMAFLVGMMITRLPCSHVFHGDCILHHQIIFSNTCPDCNSRFLQYY